TEHLSNPKMMSLFIISMIIIGFFFANFLLHFLQQVLFLVDDFATNPEEVNFNNFSVDWHHFFIFQKKWIGFYVGFYIVRSEEHTSELQSRFDLVCRLLLEKKKQKDF